MRFAFVVLSYVYDDARAALAKRSFESLLKTNVIGIERPLLQFSIEQSTFDYESYFVKLREKFDVDSRSDIKATNKSLTNVIIASMDDLFDKYSDLTHIGLLPDDWIYNSEWLQQLRALVLRHPDAKAWSVIRSSYTRHHRILGGDGVDVLMNMHDAQGLITRENWKAYNAASYTDFTVPMAIGGGCTIDVHYPCKCPGDRWATSRDYIENIGVHPELGRLDQAIDFVGE